MRTHSHVCMHGMSECVPVMFVAKQLAKKLMTTNALNETAVKNHRAMDNLNINAKQWTSIHVGCFCCNCEHCIVAIM